MKKTPILAAMLFLLLGTACSLHSQAQFFKNLLNTVKQTAQNRANDKTSQTTNSLLNKADSATQLKSKSGGSGSTGTGLSGGGSTAGDLGSNNRVLGSFAKAAAQNPNDTSSSDLTMKALGIMSGGGGVSAADSAAAIKSFMTASGGSGVLYQYDITTTTKKGILKDTSITYLTNNGNGRKEMRIPMPGVVSGKIITIGHVAQRQYSVMLDPGDKTYSLNVIDTAFINEGGGETYQVTKVGNETVQGYPAVHVKMTSTMGSRMFKSTTTMDIWISTAVPGYALYVKEWVRI